MNFENLKVDKQSYKQYSKSKAYDKFYVPVVDMAIEQGERIDDYKQELADINNELAKERRINNDLKVRADKFKVDADKFKADADEQSNRLDDLQIRVNNLDAGLSELYERQDYLEAEIKSIDDENSVLDNKNRGINNDLVILRNNDFSELDTDTIIKAGETQLAANCERISINNTRRHNFTDELRGLEVRIGKKEAENYSIIKEMVLRG